MIFFWRKTRRDKNENSNCIYGGATFSPAIILPFECADHTQKGKKEKNRSRSESGKEDPDNESDRVFNHAYILCRISFGGVGCDLERRIPDRGVTYICRQRICICGCVLLLEVQSRESGEDQKGKSRITGDIIRLFRTIFAVKRRAKHDG